MKIESGKTPVLPLGIACELMPLGITTEDVLNAPSLPPQVDVDMLRDRFLIDQAKIADLEFQLQNERTLRLEDQAKAERKAAAMRRRIEDLKRIVRVKNKVIGYYRSANLTLTQAHVLRGWGNELWRGFNHVTGLGKLYGSITEQLPTFKQKTEI